MTLPELVADRRVLVCVGRGGVGKTTISAALGILAAGRGRRTLVLTVDPARRLAQALGLADLPRGGAPVDPARLAAAGLTEAAVLEAGMLDARRTWDDLVARLAPTAALRETILANPFYQQLSTTFAGSTEYAAVEALCEVVETGDHALVVLDTPPAAHAMQFLEAPRRLTDLFEADAVSWIVGLARGPEAGPWGRVRRVWRALARRIEGAAGTRALTEIAEFFEAAGGVLAGVVERAHRVEALLRGPDAAFVLVVSPEADPEDPFPERMAALGLSLGAVVVNRTHLLGGDGGHLPDAALLRPGLLERLPDLDPALADWLLGCYARARAAALDEADRLARLRRALPEGVPVTTVPEQPGDVHDPAHLAALAAALGRGA